MMKKRLVTLRWRPNEKYGYLCTEKCLRCMKYQGVRKKEGKKMKAVILAAGRGIRMSPLTAEVPKPLLRVCGKTFLDYIIEVLTPMIDEFVIVVGYKGDLIRYYITRNYAYARVRYLEQRSLNGTGHALMLARPFFAVGERFCLCYADEIITAEEVGACVSYEESWLCHRVHELQETGKVRVDARGRIVEVVERPTEYVSCLAAGGFLVITADIFDYTVPLHCSMNEYVLTDAMREYIRDHSVYAVEGREEVYFTTPRDIVRYEQRVGWRDNT